MSKKARELSTWLDKYAFEEDISNRPLLPDEFYHNREMLHSTYKLCFEEITKHCSVLCNEHGKILTKIWSMYVENLKDSYEYQIQKLCENNNNNNLENNNESKNTEEKGVSDEELSTIGEVEKSTMERRNSMLTRRSSIVRDSARSNGEMEKPIMERRNSMLTRRSSIVRDSSRSNFSLTKEKLDSTL